MCLLFSAAVSCGPELTDPASTNITGRWTSSGAIGPLSDISMNLAQETDGSVSGQWSGIGSPPNPVCPPGLGSAPVGTVSGSNTVLEVRLSLLGAGVFAGQVGDDDTLRGSFIACEIPYPVTFSRESPAP